MSWGPVDEFNNHLLDETNHPWNAWRFCCTNQAQMASKWRLLVDQQVLLPMQNIVLVQHVWVMGHWQKIQIAWWAPNIRPMQWVIFEGKNWGAEKNSAVAIIKSANKSQNLERNRVGWYPYLQLIHALIDNNKVKHAFWVIITFQVGDSQLKIKTMMMESCQCGRCRQIIGKTKILHQRLRRFQICTLSTQHWREFCIYWLRICILLHWSDARKKWIQWFSN